MIGLIFNNGGSMFSEIKIILDNTISHNSVRKRRRKFPSAIYDTEETEISKYGKVEINGLINNGFILLWMSKRDFKVNKQNFFFGKRFNYFNAEDFKIWMKHINFESYSKAEDKATRYNMKNSDKVINDNKKFNNNLIMDRILKLIINSENKRKIVYSKPKNEYEKIFYAYAGVLPFNKKNLLVSKNENKLHNYYFLNNEGVYNNELLELLINQKTQKNKESLAFEYMKNSNNNDLLNKASKIKNKFTEFEIKELCFRNFNLNKEIWNNMMQSSLNCFINYSGFSSSGFSETPYIYDDNIFINEIYDEVIRNTFLTKEGCDIKNKILDFIESSSSEIRNKRFRIFPKLWNIYQIATEDK